MENYICLTCATQYAASAEPPEECRICTDDRQYVGYGGQQWTTHAELVERLHTRIEFDAGLLGVGIVERFAIPQRALIVPAGGMRIMWDCIGVATPDAVAELQARGGIDAIAISHPHFYSAMVEWSDAFGGIPIHLHAADERWICRPSPHISLWDGDQLELAAGATLIHLPGHFPGSAALLWDDQDTGRRSLLTGDSLYVAADRRHVTVMYSVPNYIPVGPRVIEDLRQRLKGLDVDDVYGLGWGQNIIGDGQAAIEESLDRYLAAISR